MQLRRRFLKQFAGLLTASSVTAYPEVTPGESQKSVIDFQGDSADSLQKELLRRTGSRCTIRLSPSQSLVCTVREDAVADEKSVHALLIPENVHLDLQGGTLLLDLRSNSYGIRLSSQSSISNGTVRVIHSEGKGSQGCWHSAISIGAAYGDGGVPEKPGHFSTVSHWTIENMTIDQQVEASAIQLMSEACFGSIRNVTILDSAKALLGIGMDWGSVGPITTADQQIAEMREFLKQKKIYSTHPHDITVENIRIGRLLRNKDANDAGIRCSACHRITLRNIEVEYAAAAVAIWGGDCGYEFAGEDEQAVAHSGYLIENVSIRSAQRFGIVLNGSSDNILRAQRDFGYQPLLDPVHPGILRPVIRRLSLSGGTLPGSQGLYAVAVRDAALEDLTISGFSIGVHVEDWVHGMRFVRCQLKSNARDRQIEGATEPASNVVFDPDVR